MIQLVVIQFGLSNLFSWKRPVGFSYMNDLSQCEKL